MPTRIILLINILVNKYLFYMPECQLFSCLFICHFCTVFTCCTLFYSIKNQLFKFTISHCFKNKIIIKFKPYFCSGCIANI
ncbi:hypothetical protein HMPREF0999_01706 [Parabacteroides sp. D25]|nr:hypothetical protein HMPREF0999_01706 [Parabacteroides sp. D25]KMW37133.1 hypothetical protein BSDG_04679 [Parabacteroides sp. 2_1_7]